MSNRTGFLTIFSADGSEVYGEFADAAWKVETTHGEKVNVFSGLASEGAVDTFKRLDEEGISYVSFAFESQGERFGGEAQLLAPVHGHTLGQTYIKIETSAEPAKAVPAG